MAKEESVVKSFRIANDLFECANEVFKKEGFSLSEVVRLLCDATVREGRIPRGLSTRELESKLDSAQIREAYIDEILSMAGIVPENQRGLSTEERLYKAIFTETCNSSELSNENLREWAHLWGFPDNLSIATLAELHDCGLFGANPWDGIYDTTIEPVAFHSSDSVDGFLESALIILECQNNICDNLEQLKRGFQARAIKYLMECNNVSTHAVEEMEGM